MSEEAKLYFKVNPLRCNFNCTSVLRERLEEVANNQKQWIKRIEIPDYADFFITVILQNPRFAPIVIDYFADSFPYLIQTDSSFNILK